MECYMICECGSSSFLYYYDGNIRCTSCKNGYTKDGDEFWLRRYNKKTEKWERNREKWDFYKMHSATEVKEDGND